MKSMKEIACVFYAKHTPLCKSKYLILLLKWEYSLFTVFIKYSYSNHSFYTITQTIYLNSIEKKTLWLAVRCEPRREVKKYQLNYLYSNKECFPRQGCSTV